MGKRKFTSENHYETVSVGSAKSEMIRKWLEDLSIRFSTFLKGFTLLFPKKILQFRTILPFLPHVLVALVVSGRVVGLRTDRNMRRVGLRLVTRGGVGPDLLELVCCFVLSCHWSRRASPASSNWKYGASYPRARWSEWSAPGRCSRSPRKTRTFSPWGPEQSSHAHASQRSCVRSPWCTASCTFIYHRLAWRSRASAQWDW